MSRASCVRARTWPSSERSASAGCSRAEGIRRSRVAPASLPSPDGDARAQHEAAVPVGDADRVVRDVLDLVTRRRERQRGAALDLAIARPGGDVPAGGGGAASAGGAGSRRGCRRRLRRGRRRARSLAIPRRRRGEPPRLRRRRPSRARPEVSTAVATMNSDAAVPSASAQRAGRRRAASARRRRAASAREAVARTQVEVERELRARRGARRAARRPAMPAPRRGGRPASPASAASSASSSRIVDGSISGSLRSLMACLSELSMRAVHARPGIRLARAENGCELGVRQPGKELQRDQLALPRVQRLAGRHGPQPARTDLCLVLGDTTSSSTRVPHRPVSIGRAAAARPARRCARSRTATPAATRGPGRKLPRFR